MKLLFALLLLLMSLTVQPWGFGPHRTINHHAVFLLPASLYAFYRPHIQEITLWATKADQRRYLVEGEGAKHFIDIDRYESAVPLDSICIPWDSAVSKYSEDSLAQHGILPWNILVQFHRLKWAFLRQDSKDILRLSADLGHYIADAHVPLHTTANYNGQLTQQEGIHRLWETRLPQLFGEQYSFFSKGASFLSSPDSAIWECIEQSHAAVDSVLGMEHQAAEQWGQIHGYEVVNGRTVKVYHHAFCESYHQMMGRMVERRMRQSMKLIADFWFTAWREAGQLLPIDRSSIYHLPDSFPPSSVPLEGRSLLH